MQVRVKNVDRAKRLLGQAASFRRQQGARSHALRFTTLYLYKEGGATASVMQHSLSGQTLPRICLMNLASAPVLCHV